MDLDQFYNDMTRLNNELVNLQRELTRKNVELGNKNAALKASEEALRESQRFFAEVADTLPVLFWMAGIDMQRTWFNQYWLEFTGRTLSEETGDTWADGIFIDDRERHRQTCSRAFDSRQPYAIEYRLRYRSGEHRWIYEKGYPRIDSQQNFLGFTGFGIDFTERKQTETLELELEAAKRLNIARNRLLDNISHEIRTPLTSIKGYIETLLEPGVKWTKSQQAEFLSGANQNADHLTIIVRNLLDLAHIESGQLILHKELRPWQDVLNFASARLKTLTRQHLLKVNPANSLPLLQYDKERMAQVITNLVDNAAKFSADGCLIEIGARVMEDMLIVNVSDQGAGIPPGEVAVLFSPLYQAKMALQGKSTGLGTGLTICKAIVEAHGGQIWVDSCEGQGSKFYFSLPLNK